MADAAASRYNLRSSRAVVQTLEASPDEDASDDSNLDVDEDEFAVSDIEYTEQESDDQYTEEQVDGDTERDFDFDTEA